MNLAFADLERNCFDLASPDYVIAINDLVEWTPGVFTDVVEGSPIVGMAAKEFASYADPRCQGRVATKKPQV